MNLTNLKDILEAKEARSRMQERLLSRGGVLITFCVNIPGPVKNAKLYRLLFEEGLPQVRYLLKAAAAGTPGGRKAEELILEGAAGPCAFFFFEFRETDCRDAAVLLKRRLVRIEEEAELGRLYDIDVLFRTAGQEEISKVGRRALGLPERKCLLCENSAFTCVRAGRHRVSEVLREVVDRITSSEDIANRLFGREVPADTPEEYYAETVAVKALKALLYEVITTPKPGLVDTENNGAHKDMDLKTFFDSAVAVTPYFKQCVLEGMEHCNLPEEELLPYLRPLGMLAEEDMLRETDGVNTHRGAIFTLGIFCALAGMLCGRGTVEGLSGEIPFLAGKVCKGMENGSDGIRNEAKGGYPSVRLILGMLPEDGKAMTEEAGVRALLRLMSIVEDANLLRRGGTEALSSVRRRAESCLQEDVMISAERLDRELIGENLSPGGSADLLAAAFFLKFLGDIEN